MLQNVTTWYNKEVLSGTRNTLSAANLVRRSAMSTVPQPRFFVYVLARPNGKPFYVGKGQGRRVFRHDIEARAGHDCHKCNVIRKIWKSGGDVQRYIIFTTNDEQEALAYEVETIALYGRKNLTNKTDGGDGISGYKHTAEWRSKLSATQKGRTATPETRAKLRAARRGFRYSPESRAKMSVSQRGRTASAETRAKLSASLKGRTFSLESRAKLAAAAKARWANPEFRARASASMKVAHDNPETRARHSAASKARPFPPGFREAGIKENKTRIISDGTRAKLSAASKARWDDPDERARMTE
jgi:hypothetical protein